MVALDRLCQDAVDTSSLDFLRHQTDADEDRDEEPEDLGRGEPQVFDDLDVLACGELTNQIRPGHHHNGEEQKVVQDLVAHRLAEHVDRNRENGSHDGVPDCRAATCSTK